MPSRFTAQSGKGVLLVALALVATLLVPSVYTWAVKPQIDPGRGNEKLMDDAATLAYFQRIEPVGHPRPLGIAPVPDALAGKPLPAYTKRDGLLWTGAGYVNPKNPNALKDVPEDLRGTVVHKAPVGKGFGLSDGVGIIQISKAALSSRPWDDIEGEIRTLGGRILTTIPERGVIVAGDNKAMASLVLASFVEASMPYPDAAKLSADIGRMPLINKVRANRSDFDLNVRTWHGFDVDGALADVQKIVGKDRASLDADGLTIKATATTQEAKRIAKIPAVSNIEEDYEYILNSFVYTEFPPVVQVGENEHTFSGTPYWDAGVDGGGCGHCESLNNIECNTDADCLAASDPLPFCIHADAANCSTTGASIAVPATLVAITDNGASTDSASLSNTLANTPEANIVNDISLNHHRKIAKYVIVSDAGDTSGLGTTCDGVLSGSQTHGNVVAGMIAGNASQLLGPAFFKRNGAVGGPVYPFNLDGAARGARLVVEDAGGPTQCAGSERQERGGTLNPGTLTPNMSTAYTAGARLHVMPFGIPNFGGDGPAASSKGLYTINSRDLDLFLVNNLEYMVFAPVGNRGVTLTNNRDLITDFFDGDSTNDAFSGGGAAGNFGNQIAAPATAKDIVSVGGVCMDVVTTFGAFNEEENSTGFTSKGPASNASLRTAPILIGVANDRTPTAGTPPPYGIYTVKSNDNNQGGPVDFEVDEQARGTSFGAGSVAAAATLLADYIAQGFYPTGSRVQTDRLIDTFDVNHPVAKISGAAIKAALAASANFTEEGIGASALERGMDDNDIKVATSRGGIISIQGVPTVLANNQQGYGRPVLSQVLPLANWPNVDIPPDVNTPEKPAMGLLIWDYVANGEPPIGNTSSGGCGTSFPNLAGTDCHEHHFRVLSNVGQIRICLAWPDPPGVAEASLAQGAPLINDLDLEVVTPSGTTVYEGNLYDNANPAVGQWGLPLTVATNHDTINPIECVHLSDNPDRDPATNDNQLATGVWKVRVRRGTKGSLNNGTITGNTGANEDANGNFRLDGGEDTDVDGILDTGGQTYGLVVSGPLVVEKDASNPAAFANFPQANVRLDKMRYTCADDAIVQVQDADASVSAVGAATTARVRSSTGVVKDTENGIGFGGSVAFASNPIAVRLSAAPTAQNGVLEGDTGDTIEVTYADPTLSARTVFARAPIDCQTNFLAGQFGNPGFRNTTDLVFGGCDHDQFFDENEVVTYSVSIVNNSIVDQFTDVIAHLEPCSADSYNGSGVCTAPLAAGVFTVLDNDQNIGRVPLGNVTGVNFSIKMGPLGGANRVFLRLNLSQTSHEITITSTSFTFSHALGSDRKSEHYSTDFPAGSTGPIARDTNRTLQIEPNDRPALSLGLHDETVTFNSWFAPIAGTDATPTRINNVICLGANNPVGSGCTGADEVYPVAAPGVVPIVLTSTNDTSNNGILDRHVLDAVTPSAADRIPWNFDSTDTNLSIAGGGWYTVRDNGSTLGQSGAVRPLWHYVNSGLCGFQTQSRSNCTTPGTASASNSNPGTPGFFSGGNCIALCQNKGGYCSGDTSRCCTSVGSACTSPSAGTCTLMPSLPAFKGGVWHTGSGKTGVCSNSGATPCYLDSDCPPSGTCSSAAADYTTCGNYGSAFLAQTTRRAEWIYDYMMSPVIEKVNQGCVNPSTGLAQTCASGGFPFTVEFQRLAFNATIQEYAVDQALIVDIDNNIDSGNPQRIIRPGVLKGDGRPYSLAVFAGPIDPFHNLYYYDMNTFGQTSDPDGSLSGGTCNLTPSVTCTSALDCPKHCSILGIAGTGSGTVCDLNSDCPSTQHCSFTTGTTCTLPSQCPATKRCRFDPSDICTTSADCLECDTGPLAGSPCNVTADCRPTAQGTCSENGATCTVNTCVGGTTPGAECGTGLPACGGVGTCTGPSDCPTGETCVLPTCGALKHCSETPGVICINNGDCPQKSTHKTTNICSIDSCDSEQCVGETCSSTETCGGFGVTVNGDETGFPGFDTLSNNYYATKPKIPVSTSNRIPFPSAGDVHVGEDTVAGPSRAVEIDLVDYEDFGEQFYSPGDAGNRFQIGFAFQSRESVLGAGEGDFGVALDDIVFEWDEVHPAAETTTSCARLNLSGTCSGGSNPGTACSFNGTGSACLGGGTCSVNEIAAGHRCSSLNVDRSALYDCNETLNVTVNDSRYADGTLGTTGVNTIQINVWSDSEPFPGESIILTESHIAGGTDDCNAGSPVNCTTGIFKGPVPISGVFNSPGVVFTTPGTEQNVFFAYEDSDCDSNQNHIKGQSDFNKLDGDNFSPGKCSISGADCVGDVQCPVGQTCNNILFPPAPTGTDNCPDTYNENQNDVDSDRVGDACDNCPFIYNPNQEDGDTDGAGNACDYEDVDGDGVINDVDNCPDVFNPTQSATGGGGGRGSACDGGGDADLDGLVDSVDRCVHTSSAGNIDTDGAEGNTFQRLGDQCDPDCLGTCSITTSKQCYFGFNAKSTQFGGPFSDIPLSNCPGTETCNRVCSKVNDDADIDEVKDRLDNCAVTYNQTILPGSDPPIQSDDNFNGIGNACDPVGHSDENRDGIPDDVANGPFFSLAVTCKNVPLANVVVLAVIVRDEANINTCTGTGQITTRACTSGPNIGLACTTLGATCASGGTCADVVGACGDGDRFADPGELVRIALVLQNIGSSLTGVNLSLTSSDPDIACIRDASITIPSFPAGSTVDTRTLPFTDSGAQSDGNFFEVAIAPTTQTTLAARPARGNMVMTLGSTTAGGTTAPIPITLLEDLDLAGGSVTPTPARCDGDMAPGQAGNLCPSGDSQCGGVIGACKPGLIHESFEDSSGVGPGTGGLSMPNGFTGHSIGFIEKNDSSDSATTMSGPVCFGFAEVFNRTPAGGCQIDPDFQTDWHYEVFNGTQPKNKAFRGNNSAHWGRHTDATARAGDTTPGRQIEAFVTNPINLTVNPGAGDLVLSFYHIIAMTDDNAVNFLPGHAGDLGDVQISVDEGATGSPDAPFGRWQKLIPFQNVYDHVPEVYSRFAVCGFTPGDAALPTDPTNYGQTMCFSDGIWSHSGNVLGSNKFDFFQAQGPGFLGSQGEGTWVQTKFNLSLYIGQRVRIRWVGQGWEGNGNGWNSNMEPPGGANPFDLGTNDDGWWIDSIQLTGAITTPAAPSIETGAVPYNLNPSAPQCTAIAADKCIESTSGTGGTGIVVNFTLSDNDGDGTITRFETIVVDASQTTNPGGCIDGALQFRFTKDPGAVLLQDWSTNASYITGDTQNGDTYKVQVRCSSDPTCITSATALPGSPLAVSSGIGTYTVPPPNTTTNSPPLGHTPAPGALTGFWGSFLFTGCPNGAPICESLWNFFRETNPLGTPTPFSLASQEYSHSFMQCQGTSPGNCFTTLNSWTGYGSVACQDQTGNAVATNGNSCDVDSPGPSDTSVKCSDVSAAPPVGSVRYYYAAVETAPSGACVAGQTAPSVTHGAHCYDYDNGPTSAPQFVPVLAATTSCP